MEELMHDCLVHNAIALISADLTEQISEVSLIKFDGSYVHLRLAPHGNSCGFVYGVLEDMKAKHPMREYNCKQSSLEMIFNAFAIEDQYKGLNRRLTRNATVLSSMQ